MLKTQAIELLGGTVTAVANAVGISVSAVTQWPDELPSRIEDRVLAALARQRFPDLLDTSTEPKAA
jgi:hypothetical protein